MRSHIQLSYSKYVQSGQVIFREDGISLNYRTIGIEDEMRDYCIELEIVEGDGG
jgi:hypothetical protein